MVPGTFNSNENNLKDNEEEECLCPHFLKYPNSHNQDVSPKQLVAKA